MESSPRSTSRLKVNTSLGAGRRPPLPRASLNQRELLRNHRDRLQTPKIRSLSLKHSGRGLPQSQTLARFEGA